MCIGLFLTLCTGLPARADFCDACRGKVRNAAMGKCTSCGEEKATSLGNKLCPDCSKKQKSCEACGAALPDTEPAKRIEDLIRQLGDEATEKREEAQAALIALGEGAHPQLRKAAAGADDPEIRLRCEAILKDFDVNRWSGFLFEALETNEELRADMAKRARHEGQVPAMDTLRRPGVCVLRETADDDAILTGKVRFFTVPVGTWETPGKPGRSMTKPEPVFVIAITDAKHAIVLSHDDLPTLQKLLKPAADGPAAVKTAILAARLICFCPRCQKDLKVDAEKCRVQTLPDGGFEVTIPQEAVSPNKSEEGAVVTFTKEGQLKEATRTGHKFGHQ